MIKILFVFIFLSTSYIVDRFAKPRDRCARRHPIGTAILFSQLAVIFGLAQILSGHFIVSLFLSFFLLLFFISVSNAKYATLGEALVFSDLALIGAVFRHPHFYLSALTLRHKLLIIFTAATLVLALLTLASPELQAHLWGIPACIFGLATQSIVARFAPSVTGDLEADTNTFGLTPTLFLHWHHWRKSAHPAPWTPVPRQADPSAPELVIVVQCESFADPAELFSNPLNPAAHHLSGLAQARADAWQWGKLSVSGFGAYTMRTEYGVLFGRSEHELGLRQYDPLLTAAHEGSYAIPAKLEASDQRPWRTYFVHPHDMRFYGRDVIMPAAKFDSLIGEEAFSLPLPHEGRYVTDDAVCKKILEIAARSSEPLFVYSVTIENHGPWSPDIQQNGFEGPDPSVSNYIKLVQHSDTMLANLQSNISTLAAEQGRPAMLVFFGDHRPSIPKATSPHGDRHTPYVLLRFDHEGKAMRGNHEERNATPAELHHDILNIILGTPKAPRSP